MNNSILKLIAVHFKSFFREPAILFWAIMFPILMAWVLGIAFTQKGEVKKTVYVINDSNSKQALSNGEEKVFGEETGNPTRIKFISATREEAYRALKRGTISLFIEEKGDSLRYHFDPKNADAQLTHLIIERGLNESLNGKASAVPSSVSALTTKGTRYIDFLIPGLIALGIMNSCLWGISYNLIEFRMKKLLRRMVATPMKKSYFLISHILTRIILSSVESGLLFLFAFIYFGTTIEGSISGFVLIYLAGIFAFSGISILLASRTSSSQVGNGLINAISLPMMILSGIFFSYQNFPEWALPVIKALPLTLIADTIRSVFIEGMTFPEVLMPSFILTVIGLVTFAIGLKLFKWY